nr:glucoamylase [Acidobacteriota bacterium]
MRRQHIIAAALALALLAPPATARAQTGNNLAPGAPGKDAHWPSAGKDGVGTSNTLESKVWFTLRDGVMTEVYYPTVDVANTQVLQLLVADERDGRVETEEEMGHGFMPTLPDSLSFRQVNRPKDNSYTINKTYTADPERHTVLIRVGFRPLRPGKRLYVYYDPSLNNSGMHDSAWDEAGALVASDADKSSALVSSAGFDEITHGYLGTSDG